MPKYVIEYAEHYAKNYVIEEESEAAAKTKFFYEFYAGMLPKPDTLYAFGIVDICKEGKDDA